MVRRPLAASLVLLIAVSTLLVPAGQANDSLTSRTDGAWTYKYGIANTDGLILQEVKYNGKYLFGKLSLVQVEVEYIKGGVTTDVLYDEMGHGTSTATTMYRPYGAMQRTIGGDGSVYLIQEFRNPGWAPTNSCDYRYKVEYHLHPNGDIHPWGLGVWAWMSPFHAYSSVPLLLPRRFRHSRRPER